MFSFFLKTRISKQLSMCNNFSATSWWPMIYLHSPYTSLYNWYTYIVGLFVLAQSEVTACFEQTQHNGFNTEISWDGRQTIPTVWNQGVTLDFPHHLVTNGMRIHIYNEAAWEAFSLKNQHVLYYTATITNNGYGYSIRLNTLQGCNEESVLGL